MWPYIFKMRTESEDSRGFTCLCNQGQDSTKSAVWTAYIWHVHWVWRASQRKALLVLYYHISSWCIGLFTVLTHFLMIKLPWLFQFVLYQLTLNSLDLLLLNSYCLSTSTTIFVYLQTKKHGFVSELACFTFDKNNSVFWLLCSLMWARVLRCSLPQVSEVAAEQSEGYSLSWAVMNTDHQQLMTSVNNML